MNSFRSYFTKFICVMFALFVPLLVSQNPRAMAQSARFANADTTTTSLTGTDWQLVSLGTPGNLLEPVSGTTITAQFDENQLSGSGGCNGYAATYKSNDNRLTVSSPTATEIACFPPEINLLESRYFAALAGAQRYQLTSSGRLKIFYQTDSEDGVLVFASRNTSTVNLAGTSWRLVSLKTPENLSEPIIGFGGRTLSAQFTEDRVGGSSGCNSYGATYQTNDSKLSISSLISTKIACTSEINQQESRYFAALAGAQNYVLTEYGQLEISYQTETESGVLIFDPQQTEA